MTHRLNNLAREAIRVRVRDHAAAQHGVFRRSDLLALGIDPEIIRSFLARNWWIRLHHGVYVDSEVLAAATDPRQHTQVIATAAISALPGPAYAFGPSAALLQGLVVDKDLTRIVSIVRPVGSDQRAFRRRITSDDHLTGVTVHRHHVAEGNLTTVEGIPCVDGATAALTTAAMSEDMWAVATLDSFVWRDPDKRELLKALLDEWRGLRGLGTARKAVELSRVGAQTALESISRFRLMSEGLDEPALQVPFHDEQGVIGYADMVWHDLRVIGEADGLGKYASREDLIAEKRREDRLRALGWVVVRWTWDEIFRSPRAVAERIRRARHSASLIHARIA